MVVIGCDISLNHGGFCFLDDCGKVIDWKFFHDVKKYVTADPNHGVLTNMKKGPEETSHAYDMRRIAHYREMFCQHILGELDVTYLPDVYYSIEGYAMGMGSKNTNRLLQIAELTGVVKNTIYGCGSKMRIHDPKTVKLFACHGSANKIEMREAAAQNGFEIPDNLFKVKKSKGRPDDLDGPGTDVIDAYWLGQMLVLELRLRDGLIVMSDLPHNQIKVFNRVTKTYPVNVLARPFIGAGDD